MGCRGEKREGFGGADGVEAGTDIEESRCDGGERANERDVGFEERNEQGAGTDKGAGEGDKKKRSSFLWFLKNVAVEAHGGDLVGAERVDKLLSRGFEKHEDASDFDSAGGGAGASADEHEEYENGLGEIGPEVKIRRDEAGCGGD